MQKIILGGHSLMVALTITLDNLPQLEKAMEAVVERGGRIFEIPYAVCQVPWQQIAEAAKRAGIEEISICHFWPKDKHGKAVLGDPLGSKHARTKAYATVDKIVEAAKTLRAGGITVRFVDGPMGWLLGHGYDLDSTEMKRRLVSFLRTVGRKLAAANLILAVEFLRPDEDKVVGGTKNMIAILREVNLPNVKMHFDVYHSFACGEDPAEMVMLACNWIVYIHGHGDLRAAPGGEMDNNRLNWFSFAGAVATIDSGVDTIPLLLEPFSEDTCYEEPTLGVGLPPMGALLPYLDTGFQTLKEVLGGAGIEIAA